MYVYTFIYIYMYIMYTLHCFTYVCIVCNLDRTYTVAAYSYYNSATQDLKQPNCRPWWCRGKLPRSNAAWWWSSLENPWKFLDIPFYNLWFHCSDPGWKCQTTSVVPRNLRISTFHFLMRGMVKAVVDTLSIAQAGKSPESSGNALHCKGRRLEKIVGSWRWVQPLTPQVAPLEDFLSWRLNCIESYIEYYRMYFLSMADVPLQRSFQPIHQTSVTSSRGHVWRGFPWTSCFAVNFSEMQLLCSHDSDLFLIEVQSSKLLIWLIPVIPEVFAQSAHL